MLNFNLSIGLEVIESEYPIMFDKKNECIHCGAVGTLTFVDKFGKETGKEIHPFDHIKCRNCGRNYSILWERDENNNGKMYPIATDPGIKREFLNLVSHKYIKNKGVKEI